MGTLGWKDRFDLLFNIDYFGITGSEADTIGFSGSRLFDIGLPNNFNDTAYTIAIGPIGSQHIGKTVCLDSAFYLPSGRWMWHSTTGGQFFPSWDGPHCYQVDGLDIAISFKYREAGPTDTVTKTMRNVYVEMWDEDDGEDDLLASGYTEDNTGYVNFPAVSNYDAGGTGGQDVYFVVWAVNEAARMTINPSQYTTSWTSDTTNDMSSGPYYWGQTATVEPSKPFYVADRVLDAYRKWNQISPSDLVSDSLEVILNPSATTASHYDRTNTYLYINDANVTNLQAPDTWDSDVIWHEYGHHIESYFGFFDIFVGDHEIFDTISEGAAASEGFCTWWACVGSQNNVWNNSFDNFQDTMWYNPENGVFGNRDSLMYGVNAMGVKNEGAVAGILWDIYDGSNDDWSNINDFHYPYDTTDSQDDAYGDSLSNGYGNILEALLDDGRMVNGHHPDDILEFWDAWFDSPELGWDRELANIYFEHGDSTRPCCYGLRGNVDGNEEEEPDISDLIYLVDYMFTGGPAPPCMAEADFDASQDIDISDLVGLVDYMFTGGVEPWSCYDKKHQTD